MSGLTLNCPQCKQRMKIRTSRQITEMSKEAYFYCVDCGIRTKALTEIIEIEIAEFKPMKSFKPYQP